MIRLLPNFKKDSTIHENQHKCLFTKYMIPFAKDTPL
jgi:hypothetical protein